MSMKQVVWSGKTQTGQDGSRDVYLFDAFVRPVADASIPLICVVLDQHGDIVCWANVAIFSVGFLSATLDDDVLTITAIANWFYGKGIYRYALGDRSITALDEDSEDNFVKFEDEDRAGERREWVPRDPALEDVMKAIRDRQESL